MAQNVDVAREPLTGVELIGRERERQKEEEGWTVDHDDRHTRHELAIVAACYAAHDTGTRVVQNPKPGVTVIAADAWPGTWAKRWDKRDKHPRLRQLAIAGALIAAEIDRLQHLGLQDEADAEEDRREKWQEEHPDVPQVVAVLSRAIAGGNKTGLREAAEYAISQLRASFTV